MIPVAVKFVSQALMYLDEFIVKLVVFKLAKVFILRHRKFTN